MVRIRWVSCCATLCFVESPAQEVPQLTLDEVLVEGERPGPALWKVLYETPAGEHVMWVLGGPPPIGRDLQWSSKRLERIVADSQELLFDSSLTITVAEDVSMWRIVTLLPSAIGVRKNIDDLRLVDVLPNDLFLRWQAQKKRYLGRDTSIEKWRPMFAADELKSEALKQLALGTNAGGRVYKLAKERGVHMTYPMLTVKLPIKGMRSTIKEFRRQPMDDVECFAATVAFVEAISDGATTAARAQAWAVGDLDALRRLPAPPNPNIACGDVMLNVDVAKQYYSGNAREELRNLWFQAAEKSLAANESTLAVLPVDELLAGTGRLAALHAKGYSVVEP